MSRYTEEQDQQWLDAQTELLAAQTAAFRAQSVAFPQVVDLLTQSVTPTPFVPADFEVRRSALMAAATFLARDVEPESDHVQAVAREFEAYLRGEPASEPTVGQVQFGDPCPDCGGHITPADDEPDALRCDDWEGCGWTQGPPLRGGA